MNKTRLEAQVIKQEIMTNEQVYYSFKLSFNLQNIRDSKLMVFKFHDWVQESYNIAN